MREKATLKQIASELNVSISTVSKALNGSPEISETTKIKIQEYAKLRHYKPNVIGLNLKSRSTKTIGVIIPNILNPFFAKVFSGIEKAAEKQGYNVLTCISNESLQKEKNTLELLSNGTIDGFILAISEEAQKEGEFEHIKQIISEGTPVVMFDRLINEIECDKVIVDDLQSAKHATEFLIASGRKKIALMSTIDNLSGGKLRAKGFYEAFEQHGLSVDENLVILTSATAEFDDNLEKVLKAHRPDGIFALDEHASVTAMKFAIRQGFKIPDDLAIVGFADGLWSRRLTPSLSTVSQHAPEIGEAAARLMIDRLKNPDQKYRTEVIRTELRHRDSTRTS